METTKIRVKLFGESFKIHSLDVKRPSSRLELFKNRAFQLREPLETALLNIQFFNRFSSDKLNSVQDLIQHTFGGLINTTKAKIEIKKGRKILQKFTLNDLCKPITLFPIFNVYTENINLKLNNNIFLIEKEVGLIDTYVIEVENFDIYKLKFNICDVNVDEYKYQLLQAVSYNSKKLKSINSDALITYQHCISNIT